MEYKVEVYLKNKNKNDKTWRQLRKYGVFKIKKSIQICGVLSLSFWCVMKTKQRDYLAIDCNHQLYAFKAEEITMAKTLVFPTLFLTEYKVIAGVCNEIHDQRTIYVTNWDKFYVLQQMLQFGEYTKGKNVDFSKLEKNIVRLCRTVQAYFFGI